MAKNTGELKGEIVHKELMKYLSDDISYIDAIVEYCHDNDLELEVVASIIKRSPTLKGKVQEDAESRNMVKEDGNKIL